MPPEESWLIVFMGVDKFGVTRTGAAYFDTLPSVEELAEMMRSWDDDDKYPSLELTRVTLVRYNTGTRIRVD